MSTLYITTQGAMVTKTSERLKITLRKEVLAEVPLIKVSQLVLFGHVSVTPDALRELLKHEIDICYLTQHGDFICRVQPEISKHVALRVAQYRAMFDPAQQLAFARQFVLGKLANLRTTLQRKGKPAEHKTIKTAIERIKGAEASAKTTDTLDALRGHEGDGSAAYFGVFDDLIKAEGFTFAKRVRRPPTDPVNALLSFGYTLLMNDLLTAVNIVGFDQYIGYLHAEHYGRPSLALDLMEEFRPVIVDALVLTCLNKKILTIEQFEHTEAGTYRLTDTGRRTFLAQYEQRRKTEITHPINGEKMTYQRAFEEQARLLARALLGEREDYPAYLIK